jgi:hypothetical protein
VPGSSKHSDNLLAVAEQFASAGGVLTVEEYGSGNVNDTYLVTQDSAKEKHFILQRISTRVFPRPELIMRNLRVFSDHVRVRLEREPLEPGRRWEMPRIFRAQDGQDFFIASDGSFWRAMSFIERVRSYDQVKSIAHAREVGYALGRFQSLISDLEVARLYDTLEGFHITPRYLRHYDEVLGRNTPQSPEVAYGARFVAERRQWASVLEDAKNQGRLRLRPIHGDPKVNNVLIDETTGQAVSIVDLDTVKPGLVHYDTGDCLRSCCNPLGEETQRIEEVHFETDICRAILEGYLPLARGFLDENDYPYLYDSVRLIAFELGLRFFTDYLEGNVYFKVRYPEHNLQRALVQFRLTESIESHESEIRTIIDELR